MEGHPTTSSGDHVAPLPFTGGPEALFDVLGRDQLIALLQNGLTPASTVADIGCGALRGGRWVIPLLEPEHYCGVEPNETMLNYGLERFMDADVVALKRPRFDHNASFDLSPFGTTFTHVMLRSIWTHASKRQIQQCLDSIAAYGTPDVVALASVLTKVVPIKVAHPRSWEVRRDYRGDSWVGRSHESDEPGMIWHSPRWLRSACADRGLRMSYWLRRPVGKQVWLRVTRR